MSVGDEYVAPSIIVEIEKARAPAEKGNRRRAESDGKRNIGETAAAIIVIKRIAVVRKIGDVKIEPSIVVIIAYGQTHARLFASVFVEREA